MMRAAWIKISRTNKWGLVGPELVAGLMMGRMQEGGPMKSTTSSSRRSSCTAKTGTRCTSMLAQEPAHKHDHMHRSTSINWRKKTREIKTMKESYKAGKTLVARIMEARVAEKARIFTMRKFRWSKTRQFLHRYNCASPFLSMKNR